MSVLVSIIIPCYNSAAFIEETLISVINQHYQNWECVVVDNGSTDNSIELIKQKSIVDSRIQYHRIEERGVSKARNKAISLSKGEYILPLDADDKIDITYIEKAINILEKNKDIKLVYSDAKLFDALDRNWILPDYTFKNLLLLNGIFCSAIFRKKDFEMTAGYNENMVEGYEDWDFWVTLLNKNDKVYKIPEKLFFYRIRQESRNNSLSIDKQKKLRKQLFENHKEKYAECFNNSDFIMEHYTLLNELNAIKKSKAYKIVKFITNLFYR